MRAVVTGAFSYIGSAVAGELRRRGYQTHTLTRRAAPEGVSDVTVAPLLFEAAHLERELSGADLFVNTYWIRLPHAGQTFETAVARSKMLLDAAVRARVGRVVHVSVSNAASGRNLGYYRGKADVEHHLRGLPIASAIVRPTLVVGPQDVLTNNIAWFLRRLPFFPMPRRGEYRLQPVTLADAGRIVADAAAEETTIEWDAAGPEIVTFRQYVAHLAAACGVRRWMPAMPNGLTLAGIRCVEPFLADTVLTREELLGLEQELLLSRQPGRGTESALAWLTAHGTELGRDYVNDERRHFGDGQKTPILRP